MSDLVSQLIDAAAAAIEAQRADLERNPRELKSVMIELPIQMQGQSVRVGNLAECYVQRRLSVSSALGLRG